MDFFQFSISVWVRTRVLKSWIFNIGSWTQIWSFDTPEKQNVFNFQLTCFSAFFYFTLCFCTSLSSETWNLQLISQLLLCWCSDTAFQNSYSNPYIWGVKTRISKFGVKIDIEKPEIGETEYLVYFNRPTVINNHLAIIT